jgi:hypothetical protein
MCTLARYDIGSLGTRECKSVALIRTEIDTGLDVSFLRLDCGNHLIDIVVGTPYKSARRRG